MLTPKNLAMSLAKNLPEDASWEELIHRFVLAVKLAQAEMSVRDAKCTDHDDFMKEMDSWEEEFLNDQQIRPSITIED